MSCSVGSFHLFVVAAYHPPSAPTPSVSFTHSSVHDAIAENKIYVAAAKSGDVAAAQAKLDA
eukprot:1196129-Rhodomonas_salina.1